MKSNSSKVLMLLAVAAFLVVLAGCKSSGMAVTGRGQVMKISLEAPKELSEGESAEIMARVRNAGVNNLSDVQIDVEVPSQLTVVHESHGDGMNMTESMGGEGARMFTYRVGNIEAGQDSTVKLSIQGAFHSYKQSGNIRVTAWQSNLPGDKLVETKFIKLRG
ncbi:MAG TPA: hypothetical protein VHL58_12010 [Thermoanaerobaculia bacterium]|nr:hypothetical protein [Thermoanaerobaculia bacterium]